MENFIPKKKKKKKGKDKKLAIGWRRAMWRRAVCKDGGICVIYCPYNLFSLVFLLNCEDKILWARRENFLHHFLFLLFSLLNQTRENSIFHPIFLFFFSILPVFTPTKRGLSLGLPGRGGFWKKKFLSMSVHKEKFHICPKICNLGSLPPKKL